MSDTVTIGGNSKFVVPVAIFSLDTAGNPVSGSGAGGSLLPYGADQYTITSQVAAGPHIILYKRSGVTIKTRTITYTNSGASATDTITDSLDT